MQIGIDIVSIKRIHKILQKNPQKFLQRFLLPQEIILTHNNPQTIAGFWAAKEACSKAIGTGIGKDLGFMDIEITKNTKNAPLITITEEKKKLFQINDLKLSITHETDFAIAVVITQ
ncbi:MULTISPECIES: holo-ACP synthase [unclassified Helicobacter]|uniref:holo-ACP synthase n=1 Tax=unclassified Helicobacter TaxID=2593540 RepID=UPI000CF1B985|nr:MULTISPECIES: holo-ACP synthase [unclassified Helicobacter]